MSILKLNTTMKLKKHLGVGVSKFKGQLTKDTDLMSRMDAILHIVPRIKQVIIKTDIYPKKERIKIMLTLNKMNKAVLESKLNYYEHLKLSRRFTLNSNIINLIDDIEDRIAGVIQRLVICGYDLTFFTDLCKPSVKIVIKMDDVIE